MTFRFPRFTSSSLYDPISTLGLPEIVTNSADAASADLIAKDGLSFGGKIALIVVFTALGAALLVLGRKKINKIFTKNRLRVSDPGYQDLGTETTRV